MAAEPETESELPPVSGPLPSEAQPATPATEAGVFSESEQAAIKPWEELKLTKTQWKKLQKKQKVDEVRQIKKQQKKLEKQKVQQEKKERLLLRASNMTEEETKQRHEHTKEILDDRKRRKEEKASRLAMAKAQGMKLVVDLDFGDKMTDPEIKSLCNQLQYSYSCNKHAEIPFHFILTSFTGRVEQQARRQLAGFDNWHLTTTSQGYYDYLESERDKLVYLTADSPNELDDLDASSVYIIGGLVDRNRYKRICFNKATEQGIKTARLPIAKYVLLDSSQVMLSAAQQQRRTLVHVVYMVRIGRMAPSGHQVITINQVVKIMLDYVQKRDWKEVLVGVLPTRKVAGGKRERGSEHGSEDPQQAASGSGADASPGAVMPTGKVPAGKHEDSSAHSREEQGQHVAAELAAEPMPTLEGGSGQAEQQAGMGGGGDADDMMGS